jgi:hypothetical protein
VSENRVFRIKREPKKDEVGNLGYYKYVMRNFHVGCGPNDVVRLVNAGGSSGLGIYLNWVSQVYIQIFCGESWKTAESERITLLWTLEN